ncbi:MAG TPA: hypothetical protein VGV67_11560, partial [Solirubrobacteraceae bacterium]|nr:hypothetical protein [Solirubrobacteraceae bacterium]
MTEGARCRSCGTQNEPGRDFCERCGEYLSWTPTAFVAAVPGAGAATEEVSPADASEPARTSVTEPLPAPAATSPPPEPPEPPPSPGPSGTAAMPAAPPPPPPELT